MASSYTFPLLIIIINNFLFLSISITSSNANDLLESTTALPLEKLTSFHFYFQDRRGGKNPKSLRTIGDGFGFGTTFMIDDALTEELDCDSKIIGRAQGMYSFSAQNDLAFLMVVTFAFSQGKYNGSSISMLGRNHVADDVREMPIVGGSGLFRFARGYALARTLWFDRKTRDASVEYNVTVIHF